MVEKTRRQRRVRRSLKHRRRTKRQQQRGGALSVEDVLRKIQSQLRSYRWDPAEAFSLRSLEDAEIRAMLTSTEDRSTQSGEQYVSRAYAIQMPALTEDGAMVEKTEDIRDVARAVHSHLITPDSTGQFPGTDREFKVWIEQMDDRDSAAYLEQVERQIRSLLNVYDKSVLQFKLSDEKNYPLYIWALFANASGEPEAPSLFASTEPAP